MKVAVLAFTVSLMSLLSQETVFGQEVPIEEEENPSGWTCLNYNQYYCVNHNTCMNYDCGDNKPHQIYEGFECAPNHYCEEGACETHPTGPTMSYAYCNWHMVEGT